VKALSAASEFISDIVGFFIALPGKIVDALSTLGSKLAGVFRGAISKVLSGLGELIGAIMEVILDLPGTIIEALGDLGSAIRDGLVDVLKSGWNAAIELLPSIDVDPLGRFGPSIKFDPADLLHWNAKGGIFDSPTAVGVGEAGREVIIPLEQPRRAQSLADSSGLTAMLLGRQMDLIGQAFSRQQSGGHIINVSGSDQPLRTATMISNELRTLELLLTP
jgi:hypothetical protein